MGYHGWPLSENAYWLAVGLIVWLQQPIEVGEIDLQSEEIISFKQPTFSNSYFRVFVSYSHLSSCAGCPNMTIEFRGATKVMVVIDRSVPLFKQPAEWKKADSFISGMSMPFYGTTLQGVAAATPRSVIVPPINQSIFLQALEDWKLAEHTYLNKSLQKLAQSQTVYGSL